MQQMIQLIQWRWCHAQWGKLTRNVQIKFQSAKTGRHNEEQQRMLVVIVVVVVLLLLQQLRAHNCLVHWLFADTVTRAKNGIRNEIVKCKKEVACGRWQWERGEGRGWKGCGRRGSRGWGNAARGASGQQWKNISIYSELNWIEAHWKRPPKKNERRAKSDGTGRC